MDLLSLQNRKLFSSITTKTVHDCNYVQNVLNLPSNLHNTKFAASSFVIWTGVLAEMDCFLKASVIKKTDVFPGFLYSGYMGGKRWNTDVCRSLWTNQWSHMATCYHTVVGGLAGKLYSITALANTSNQMSLHEDDWDLIALITHGELSHAIYAFQKMLAKYLYLNNLIVMLPSLLSMTRSSTLYRHWERLCSVTIKVIPGSRWC